MREAPPLTVPLVEPLRPSSGAYNGKVVGGFVSHAGSGNRHASCSSSFTLLLAYRSFTFLGLSALVLAEITELLVQLGIIEYLLVVASEVILEVCKLLDGKVWIAHALRGVQIVLYWL